MAHDATATKEHATSVNVVTKAEAKPDIALFERGRITLVYAKDGSNKSPQAIANGLTKTYPSIAIKSDVLGGLPVLRNSRFGVADVLSAICVSSALTDVAERYQGHYSQKQLKDAVRYARDFLIESLK